MGHAVGSRVGVILGTEADAPRTMRWFGKGTYKGDLPCPHLNGSPNPCIELDSGGTVWGCEVWWGSEAKIDANLAEYKDAGYTIEEVKLEDYRKAAN